MKTLISFLLLIKKLIIARIRLSSSNFGSVNLASAVLFVLLEFWYWSAICVSISLQSSFVLSSISWSGSISSTEDYLASCVLIIWVLVSSGPSSLLLDLFGGLCVRVEVPYPVFGFEWSSDWCLKPCENTIFKLYSHKAKSKRIISLMSLRYMKVFDEALKLDLPSLLSSRFGADFSARLCSQTRIWLTMPNNLESDSCLQTLTSLSLVKPLESFRSSFVSSRRWFRFSWPILARLWISALD